MHLTPRVLIKCDPLPQSVTPKTLGEGTQGAGFCWRGGIGFFLGGGGSLSGGGAGASMDEQKVERAKDFFLMAGIKTRKFKGP
jgi:hypothetical protein